MFRCCAAVMSELFLRLVNVSITAGWLILAVAAMRPLLKRAPKWLTCALWAVVAVRLVWPFSPESVLSLVPSAETVRPDILYAKTPAIESGVPAINRAVNPLLESSLSPSPAASVNPLQIWTTLAAWVWLAGMILYDAAQNTYIAARDPIGIRPLFYGYLSDGSIVFASEAKNLIGLCKEIFPFPPGHYYYRGRFVRYADLTTVREYTHAQGRDELLRHEIAARVARDDDAEERLFVERRRAKERRQPVDAGRQIGRERVVVVGADPQNRVGVPQRGIDLVHDDAAVETALLLAEVQAWS